MDIRIEPRRDGKAYLVISCERSTSGRCQWPLWQQEASGTMWRWNGSVERPTIQPSIDCQGGCGRHFTVTDGRAA